MMNRAIFVNLIIFFKIKKISIKNKNAPERRQNCRVWDRGKREEIEEEREDR